MIYINPAHIVTLKEVCSETSVEIHIETTNNKDCCLKFEGKTDADKWVENNREFFLYLQGIDISE